VPAVWHRGAADVAGAFPAASRAAAAMAHSMSRAASMSSVCSLITSASAALASLCGPLEGFFGVFADWTGGRRLALFALAPVVAVIVLWVVSSISQVRYDVLPGMEEGIDVEDADSVPADAGVAPLRALLLVSCGMVEGREGSYAVAHPQLLVYGADGRLELVVDGEATAVLDWDLGADGPKLARAAVASINPGDDLKIEAATAVVATK